MRRRLMGTEDIIDQREQSSIIFRAQCKDCSSNYTGQTSRKLATRIKQHRPNIRDCNVKTALMASHCEGTDHVFDPDETKVLNHTNSLTARLFKEA